MNTTGPEVCPVCKTKEDKPVTLVIIDGTEKDNIAQAMQVHVDCISLRMSEKKKGPWILYQMLYDEKI